jgi:hypothetical protein
MLFATLKFPVLRQSGWLVSNYFLLTVYPSNGAPEFPETSIMIMLALPQNMAAQTNCVESKQLTLPCGLYLSLTTQFSLAGR